MNASALGALSASSSNPIQSHHRGERQEALKTLTKDLKSGDLEGAQAAYASFTKNVPASVLANPDSALGQLGTALAAGDVGAAKVSLAKVNIKASELRQAAQGPSADPVRAPVTSSSGGTAGSVVNLVA